MAKKKVISGNNFKPKLPVLATAVAYLYLDYYKAPGWVWGVTATLYGLLWIVVIVLLAKNDYEEVDVFKDTK
jgi:hypothetical protein